VATRAPEPALARAPAAASGRACWWVVHELHDTGAASLAAALAVWAAPRGVVVRAMPLNVLLGRARWQLRVETQGSLCALTAPGLPLQAGAATAAMPLAGVVNRCGPVVLSPAVDDADYKSAEWSALLVAWLHGLACPVVNRPSPRQLYPSQVPVAVWRQAAAIAGLPIWPLPLRPSGAPPAGAPIGEPGLLVVGDTCFEATDVPGGAPGWPAAAHRAAAEAAARQGCDLLAWTGARDAQGTWRIGGATPWPDLRAFGPVAVEALAGRLAGPGAPAAAAP
jgi:hypothetical protein